MKKHRTYLIVGILLVLIPFSGFPRDIQKAIFVVCGLGLIVVSLREIREIHRSLHKGKVHHHDNFAESKPIRKIVNPFEENRKENGKEVDSETHGR